MTLKRNCREELYCPGGFIREGESCVSSVTEQSLPYEVQVLLHSALE